MGIFDDFFEKARSFLGQEEETQQTKKCYYELLEVPRDATDDEIKRSYRKLALKYHPDKVEPERREECTAYFVLLQAAYEVLSDPQERAFYDKHRENIIQGSSPEEKKDTGINLYPFFQKCFNGFEDDEDGFYSVYRQLFDKLAAEEYPYIEDEEDRGFPSFGYANSEYDQVVGPFYGFWSSFSTLRSFAWLDKYDLRQAPDRYTLKCMEKENKKLRDAGKKQRNEEVRDLVAYVRKRDKRIQKYRAELEDRKLKEFERVENERRRQIRENLERFKDNEVVEISQDHLDDLEKLETELDEQFGALECDDDDAEFFCIVCEKKFKTKKSFQNHEKSKKHKQAVNELREFMNEDDQTLFGEGEEENEDELQQKQGKRKKKKKRGMTEKPTNEEQPQPSEALPEERSPEEQPLEEAKVEEKAKKEKKRKPKEAEGTKQDGPTVPVPSECQVCKLEFPSRSKLFAHIKDSGHAALKTEVTVPNTTRQKKKKR
uniref:DnaJ homolog subfamily C member 21 n=2 Tax=Bursaphelenchus xylophilus TaxID=6326 RepID=A0A1I7SWF0_BURXY